VFSRSQRTKSAKAQRSHRRTLVVEHLEARELLSITPLTNTNSAAGARWPSLNNKGVCVYCSQVNGLWQVFEENVVTLKSVQMTFDNHNAEYPSIDDNGDILYFEDGGSGGIGWQIVRLSAAGGESTVEFSSQDLYSGAHRDANQYSDIASNGTSISGYNFYDFGGTFFTPTQRFDVSGVGQLPYDFGGSYNYPAINANGDILFASVGGFFSTAVIYKTTTSGPFPGTFVAYATMGRINDSGDIVTVTGDLDSPGTIAILSAPGYTQTTYVGRGSWADINNNDQVIFEAPDSNGVRQIYLYSPTVVQTQFPNPYDSLHKLLYASQNLAVNVSVTDVSDQEVKGQETFYLSTNQNTNVQGDTQLAVNGNVSLDLQPGQPANLPQSSSILSVVIPSDIQPYPPGTYYLKATFSGDDDPSGNSVAVSPALSVCVNSIGEASSFTNPANAAVFDNAVNVVKQGNPPIPTINAPSDIETFIQGWEVQGWKVKPVPGFYPYSDNGVPAIGYGSDLIDKTTGAVNVAFKQIICQYLANHPTLKNSNGDPLTFQDFLDLDPNAYIDKPTAALLLKSGFQVAYQYVTTTYSGLTLNQQAALTDVAYNVGTAGLAKFTSMNADIAMNTPFGFACAGLELVNSIRTTQLQGISPKRTPADFYYLTSSPGVADLL